MTRRRTIRIIVGALPVLCIAAAVFALVRAPRDRERPALARQDGREPSFTPLHGAARAGTPKAAASLLAKGEDPNARDASGMTPLHYAAFENHPDLVELLLAAGAEVDASGYRGWTPLHIAAALGNLEIVEMLLGRDADPNIKDQAGLTPLHQAAGEGAEEAAALLLSHGAEPAARDGQAWTPLHHAVYEGRADLAQLLLAAGAPVNARTGAGDTPLRQAQQAGQHELAELLIEHGARADGSQQTAKISKRPPPASAPASAPPSPAEARPNLLLIVVDALRADRLHCCGYGRATSPNLDSLAADGVLFTDAMAQGPETVASVPALLTGCYPREHGVMWVRRGTDSYSASPLRLPSLPDLLSKHGYATAAVSANPLIDSPVRLGRLFDHFELAYRGSDVWGVASADSVNRLARQWLDSRPRDGRPFFLFLHYLEPHNQYRPPSAFCVFGRPGYTARDDRLNVEMNEIFDPRADSFAVTDQLLSERGLSRNDVRRMSDLYDGEVLCVDRHIGRLLDHLRQTGLYDTTLIVVTADHGEAFLEHQNLEHGGSLHQELIHVPLIIRGPGLPRGSTSHALVELIDLAPTLLDAAGLAQRPVMSGRSFYQALLRGEGPPDRIGLAELPAKQGYALRLGRLKLISSPGQAELYDLSRDPGETHDLASARPAQVSELKRELRDLLAQTRLAAGPTESADPDALRALRSLGYIK